MLLAIPGFNRLSFSLDAHVKSGNESKMYGAIGSYMKSAITSKAVHRETTSIPEAEPQGETASEILV
jgi:hypothetical protein